MFSLSPEIIVLFVIAVGINLAFVYWYVTKKMSILRFDRINEFLTVKEREFQQRFSEGLKEFREASLNLQHDFKRLDRLREGMDNSFTIIENKIGEIDVHSKNLEKTANFYQQLKDSLIANNSELQTMFAKMKNLESDINIKGELLHELSSGIQQLKHEFDERIKETQKEIQSGFTQLETLGEVNSNKIKADFKADYEGVLADFQQLKHEFDEKIQETQKEIHREFTQLETLGKANSNKIKADYEDVLADFQQLQHEFDEKIQETQKEIHSGFTQLETLGKVNSNKIKADYEDVLVDFKDRIDTFMNEEKKHLAGEVETIQSGVKASIENLTSEISTEDERLKTLKERYEHWEKDLADFQEKNQDRVHEFSEKILIGFKEKIDDYQNEIIALLEKKQGKLIAQTEELIKHNEDKQIMVEDLTNFVEQAKSTVTYQIDNLADFLEQQKNNRIDTFMNEAKEYLAAEVETAIQSGMKVSIEDLRNKISNEDERLKTLKERYELWEKDLADFQEKNQTRAQEFSENILNSFKEKIDDHQNEAVTLFEKNQGKLIAQTEEFIKHNEDKQVVLDDLTKFVEEARSTVTYQIDNLVGFLEQQKNDRIDAFMNEAKEYLAAEVETAIQSGMKVSIEDLRNEVSNEDERLKTLKERYEHWEKDLADFQEKNQTRAQEFSENILNSFKEKIDDYQNEIIALLEKKQGELMAQSEELLKHSEDKQIMVEDLTNFVEQARSTVTYQIDNLAGFLEQQKKKQADLYQKNQVVLVDTFTKIKTELTNFRTQMDEANRAKKKIFGEIDSYIDVRMKDTMESEAPQVLEKIFAADFRDISSDTRSQGTVKASKGKSKDRGVREFLDKFSELVGAKAKQSVAGQTSEVLAKLENQGEWKKFLEQQTADTLLKKLKVDNIFSRLKASISKEFLRKELSEEVKDYRKQVGDITNDWNKLSSGVDAQKKFLDRLLVQGEVKVEELLETMKINLSEKQQELQDLFNHKILDMETKMGTVSRQIDFFITKSKSVEKVFVFQKEFSESMASYNQQLKNLKTANERFEEFNKKFDRFEQDTKRLEGMQKGVVEKQEVMDSLQKQLDSVMNMTGEIEENIDSVRKHSKEVNDFLKKVQTHSKEVDKIKNAISTVRELEEDSKTVKEWVSEIKTQAEQNMSKAEQFLGRVNVGEELQKKITQQLKTIEDQSFRLDEKYQSLQNFNKKFDEFDMAVYDVEQRIKVIDELKKEMAVEQENLGKLKENFNEQISILLKVINNQKDGDPKLFSELDKQFKSLPATLSAIGWSDKEIAKHLNMELFEVQVLLNNKKRKR